jgi:general secretion pathway protein J
MTGASRTRGFTLIEVLVALAIFGVMSALAYMTLGQTLNNSDMLNERMDRLQAIHMSRRSSPALPRTSHCS